MINTEALTLLLALITIILLGVYVAYLFGRRTNRFRWIEYIVFIFFPVVGTLSMSSFYGRSIIYLFLLSALVGLILEYLIGLSYHKTLGEHLWVYDRHDFQGYTSLLVLPMWGVAGVVFYLISKSVGL